MKKVILSILAISYLSAAPLSTNAPKSTDAPKSTMSAKSTDAPKSTMAAKSTDAPKSVDRTKKRRIIEMDKETNDLMVRKLRYFEVINQFTRCIQIAKTQDELDTCEDQVRNTRD